MCNKSVFLCLTWLRTRAYAPVWPKGNVLWMMDAFYPESLEQKCFYSLLTVGLWSADSLTALARALLAQKPTSSKWVKEKLTAGKAVHIRGWAQSPSFTQVRASTAHTRSCNAFCTAQPIVQLLLTDLEAGSDPNYGEQCTDSSCRKRCARVCLCHGTAEQLSLEAALGVRRTPSAAPRGF